MADPAYIDPATGVLTDGEAWVGIAHASLSLPAATVTWTSTDDGQTGDFSQYMDLVVISYTRLTGTGGGVNSEVKFNLNNNADTALYVTQQYAADTDGAGYTGINAITWKSQAPITEIDIVNRSGSHAVGSTFSMFGILPRMVA